MVGAALGGLGLSRWLVWVDGALLALLVLVALTPAIRPFVRSWGRNDPLPTHGVDAIIVLSSGVTTDSTLDGAGMDRLLKGLELLRGGMAPLLVTTRVSANTSLGRISSDLDQGRVVALVNSQSRWMVQPDVKSTHDEAILAAVALLPRGLRTVVVVTSPMHARRACAAFEVVGFNVYCVTARERRTPVRSPTVPSERVAAFQSYVYERAASWRYRQRGWIR